jgi:hypothetical protein
MDYVSFRGDPLRVSVPLWEQPIFAPLPLDRKDYRGSALPPLSHPYSRKLHHQQNAR